MRDDHIILDIGSGTGKIYEILRSKHKKCLVDMVDFSKKMCAIAMAKSYRDTKANVYCSSLNDFKPCKKYDVITSLQVIHHVPSVSEFLINCSQLMKNDGTLLVQTVGEGYLENIFGHKTNNHDLDILGRFSIRELEWEIKRTNLKLESLYSDKFNFYFNTELDVVKFIESIGTIDKINGYENGKVPEVLKRISSREIYGEYYTIVLRRSRNDK
ncbi:class I SAM-dependent methyltransferase [Brenneria alni]|uniref:class I SAM-dependent methyltransferase n=1 Tax=Brenneria alni TaxID=71656 RepID=UPI0014748F39|nr:class I SAM-dependent methyltransferase [Brenneria alni]